MWPFGEGLRGVADSPFVRLVAAVASKVPKTVAAAASALGQ